MPKRIQRSRKKGWRTPPNAVHVARGTRWGNPFKPFQKVIIRNFDLCCRTYEQVEFKWANESILICCGDVDHCLALYRAKALSDECHRSASIFGKDDPWKDLRGKDLICWCDLDKPCHADILLELANR
jgi:hypothetical protein